MAVKFNNEGVEKRYHQYNCSYVVQFAYQEFEEDQKEEAIDKLEKRIDPECSQFSDFTTRISRFNNPEFTTFAEEAIVHIFMKKALEIFETESTNVEKLNRIVVQLGNHSAIDTFFEQDFPPETVEKIELFKSAIQS